MTDFLLAVRLVDLENRLQKPMLMYRKCAGAYGAFRPYMSLSDYTTADFLQSSEITTPVLVRFSRAFAKDGEADTGRDIRGFFLKFYTSRGECDFLCHNMPTYFINDGIHLPSLYETFLPDRRTNLRRGSSFWEFAAEHPEALNALFWLYSDRGTVKSYCHMEGYGNYTLEWVNQEGKKYYVRMKWMPVEGVKYTSRQEAEFLAGFDPDVASRDFYESVENRNYPTYELMLQILSAGKAETMAFNIFDTAYAWPEEEVPYVKAGKLVINQLPEDFTRDVADASFSPDRLVPGIRLCRDGITDAMCFALRGRR